MGHIQPLSPVTIAGTDVCFAQGVKAGNSVFLSGHKATDFATGLAPEVRGKPNWCYSKIHIGFDSTSELANIIKTEVYLAHAVDFVLFMGVENGCFGPHPCALRVILTAAFGAVEGMCHQK